MCLKGNISVVVRDEPLIYDDPAEILNKDCRYNVLVVQEHLPAINADLFFFANPVAFFKNQVLPERRHVPMFTVYDLGCVIF